MAEGAVHLPALVRAAEAAQRRVRLNVSGHRQRKPPSLLAQSRLSAPARSLARGLESVASALLLPPLVRAASTSSWTATLTRRASATLPKPSLEAWPQTVSPMELARNQEAVAPTAVPDHLTVSPPVDLGCAPVPAVSLIDSEVARSHGAALAAPMVEDMVG